LGLAAHGGRGVKAKTSVPTGRPWPARAPLWQARSTSSSTRTTFSGTSLRRCKQCRNRAES